MTMPEKEQISKELKQLLDEKIHSARKNLKQLSEARDENTKSSMGDKFETGRSMTQAEIDRVEQNLNQVQDQREILEHIDVAYHATEVSQGSLVKTENFLYFISVGAGPLNLAGEQVICISLKAPLAEVMKGKKTGESFEFRGQKQEIKAIA